MPQTKNTNNPKARLSALSANKVLELILHNIQQQAAPNTQTLIEDNDASLSNAQKIKLTAIKESLSQVENLIHDAVDPSIKLNPNWQFTDPEIEQRVQVEKVLRALATTTSATDATDFYKYCVKTLAELYDAKFAFIGLINEDGLSVTTQAVWAETDYVNNFEYLLEGTPCSEIINLEKELIPTNASTIYKDDEMLVQMGVDSYFGAPIITKEHGVIGLISVMDTKPMELSSWTSPVLGVFASRLALEIERVTTVDKLKELNTTLEAKVNERTKELETINNELSAFCYSVSHDLRAPVRTIKSFSDIILEEHADQFNIEAREIFGRINHASEKLGELISDLLGLFRVTQRELIYKKVNLTELVESEIRLLQPHYAISNDQISIEPNLEIWGDEGLIKILMHNLLSNAFKYSEKNSHPKIQVGIETNEIEENPVFFVKDNGAGFDMDYADKLFKPFQRLHNESDFSGNGIGLATALRVVSKHKGKIWAESKPGNGSKFSFTLGSNSPIKS